jgi:transposase
VQTDGRDARMLCLRLDRYLAGNKDSLGVIRVPEQEEERARHWGRQREQLVHHRQKMEAQGRDLVINHGLSAPARWWRPQSWNRLGKLLPAWILAHLELYRPVLLTLDQQIGALTIELEKAAPAALPKGMGALSSVVISREICDWQRFKNRRQVSSYTGLCPGEYSSGSKRVIGSITRAWKRQAARRSGRAGMALGALSAPISRGAKVARPASKRSPRYQGAAQESHCRRRSPTRCRSLEASYWTLHNHNPRI